MILLVPFMILFLTMFILLLFYMRYANCELDMEADKDQTGRTVDEKLSTSSVLSDAVSVSIDTIDDLSDSEMLENV